MTMFIIILFNSQYRPAGEVPLRLTARHPKELLQSHSEQRDQYRARLATYIIPHVDTIVDDIDESVCATIRIVVIPFDTSSHR